jgi:hypothetical protein
LASKLIAIASSTNPAARFQKPARVRDADPEEAAVNT